MLLYRLLYRYYIDVSDTVLNICILLTKSTAVQNEDVLSYTVCGLYFLAVL